jgi:DnaA-homolog protein
MQQLTLDVAPLPQPSLRNFVEGGNAMVLSALRGLLEGSAIERRLCLWGGPGSGKTHLLRACADAANGQFIACREAVALPSSAASTALLALDDVDGLDANGQLALFNLVNRWSNAENAGALLMSCSQPPAAAALRPDLATRLAQGLVLEVAALTDADKAAALQAHASERGIELSAEVMRYLLTHMPRDLRALIAVLDALDHYSLQFHRPITVPLLRDVLHAPPATGSGA